MKSKKLIVFIVFFPACLGILSQLLNGDELSRQLLLLGFLGLAVDQARMAAIDLNHIALVRSKDEDLRLRNFNRLVISIIVLELLGFYLEYWFVGWGIQIVLLSQALFNALAVIQLHPDNSPVISARPWRLRLVMTTNSVLAMMLLGLWMQGIAQLPIVVGLWSLAIAYIIGKYVLNLASNRETQSI